MSALREGMTANEHTTGYNSPQCPVCQEPGERIVVVSQSAQYLRCKNCKLVYVDPQPTATELGRFYSDDFWQHVYDEHDRIGYELNQATEAKDALRLVRSIELKGGKRLLDIGCGYGYFLKEARDEGFEIAGIEPSKYMLEKANAFLGGEVITLGGYEKTDDLEGCFDVVTMFAVIEHLRDPADALRRIFNRLNPGGLLLLTTGMTGDILEKVIRGYSMWIDYPQHLWVFSQSSIRMILDAAGYDIVLVRPWVIRNSLEKLFYLGRILKHGLLLFLHVGTYTKEKSTMKASSGTPMLVVARKPL